jgi:transketolase
LIRVRTIIGFGAPRKQNTFEAHGSPLGPDEVKAAKENLGWPVEPPFFLPGEALERFRQAIENGQALQATWQEKFDAYAKVYPELAAELSLALKGDLPDGWNKDLPVFPAGKGQATRASSGQVLNAIAAIMEQLMASMSELAQSIF